MESRHLGGAVGPHPEPAATARVFRDAFKAGFYFLFLVNGKTVCLPSAITWRHTLPVSEKSRKIGFEILQHLSGWEANRQLAVAEYLGV